MPLKNTIAAKIFGLAVVLLLLTVVLVSLLLWQVVVLNGELGEIATAFVALTSSVANLNDYGLRRRSFTSAPGSCRQVPGAASSSLVERGLLPRLQVMGASPIIFCRG
jgi:hypothetical protein